MLVKDPMMYFSENQDWKFWNVHLSKNNSHLAVKRFELYIPCPSLEVTSNIKSTFPPAILPWKMNVGRKTTLLLKCSLFKGCFVHFRGSIICKARAEMSSFRFTSWSSPEIRPRFQMTSIYKAVCVGGTAKTWETWQKTQQCHFQRKKQPQEYAIVF